MKLFGLILCLPYLVTLANGAWMIFTRTTIAVTYRGVTVLLCDARVILLSGGLLFTGLYLAYPQLF